jgi:Novel STAND NTPase 1
LDGDDLRAAIERPAALAGLHLESGLVELLVRDYEGEAGALPLLSHALVETWRRGEANTLTVDGYRSTGGIRGAVARSADLLYDGLTAEQRHTLRSILLRLITPSVEGDPVRSRVPSRSLLGNPGRERVMAMLIRARLVTAHDESFELSHEALARAWPRLQAWLDDDVNGQRIFRHLVMAADGWDSFGRADGELYRGACLESALEWRATTSAELSDVEVAFLDASGELDVSERRALAVRADRETRQNRRLRTLVAVVAGLMVAALVVGAVAVDQAHRATTEGRVAATRELAAASATNLEADPERSVLLALAALERTGSEDGPEAWAAEDALHRALTISRIERRLPRVGGRIEWSPRDDVLAAIAPSGTGAVDIRDVATGESRRTITTGGSAPTDVAFDATGDLLGITGEDGPSGSWIRRPAPRCTRRPAATDPGPRAPPSAPTGRFSPPRGRRRTEVSSGCSRYAPAPCARSGRCPAPRPPRSHPMARGWRSPCREMPPPG